MELYIKAIKYFLIGSIITTLPFLFFVASKKYTSGYKHADVLIQAGHEGRNHGYTGAESKYGKEMDWNRDVANEAARILEAAGVSVIRTGAKMPIAKVKLALSIHFDGSKKPCRSGASIGYGKAMHKTLADKWKSIYSKVYPFDWMEDNFTDNLSGYYGYKYVFSQKGFLVLELGEITCKQEALWLRYRLKKIGRLIAYFIAQELDIEGVAMPIILQQ